MTADRELTVLEDRFTDGKFIAFVLFAVFFAHLSGKHTGNGEVFGISQQSVVGKRLGGVVIDTYRVLPVGIALIRK